LPFGIDLITEWNIAARIELLLNSSNSEKFFSGGPWFRPMPRKKKQGADLNPRPAEGSESLPPCRHGDPI
jgi:hypothetical protein